MEKFVKADEVLEFVQDVIDRKICVRNSYKTDLNSRMYTVYQHEINTLEMLLMELEEELA